MDPRWIEQRTSVGSLPDGTRVALRPVVPDDKQDIARGFEELSERSRYRRFMGALSRLSDAHLRYLTEIDYVDHFAWVAISIDEPDTPGMGVARYVRDRDDPTAAEAAVAVIDRYHGRGVGTLLLERLARSAVENGITRFTGGFVADNRPIRDMIEHRGGRVAFGEPGESRFTIALPGADEEIGATVIYELLRAAARGEWHVVGPPVARPGSPAR